MRRPAIRLVAGLIIGAYGIAFAAVYAALGRFVDEDLAP